jgi:hypothetical protein
MACNQSPLIYPLCNYALGCFSIFVVFTGSFYAASTVRSRHIPLFFPLLENCSNGFSRDEVNPTRIVIKKPKATRRILEKLAFSRFDVLVLDYLLPAHLI